MRKSEEKEEEREREIKKEPLSYLLLNFPIQTPAEPQERAVRPCFWVVKMTPVAVERCNVQYSNVQIIAY